MKIAIIPLERSQILLLRKERELCAIFKARQLLVRRLITDVVNRLASKAKSAAHEATLNIPPCGLDPKKSNRDASGRFTKGSRHAAKRRKHRNVHDPSSAINNSPTSNYRKRSDGPNLQLGVSFNPYQPINDSSIAPGGVPSNLRLDSDLRQQIVNAAKANACHSPVTGKLLRTFKPERGRKRSDPSKGLLNLSTKQMTTPGRPQAEHDKIKHLRNLMLDVLSSKMGDKSLTEAVILQLAASKPEALLQLLKTLMPKEMHVKEEKIPAPLVFDFDQLTKVPTRN